MELLLFNPEHDYALADNQPQYVPLRSAAQFACDCASLMRYLSDGESTVCDAYRHVGQEFQKNFAPLGNAGLITKVTPWGWDAAVVYQLKRMGIPGALLPSDEQLAKIRALAHRKTTVAAMEFLRDASLHPDAYPVSPDYLTDIQQVKEYVEKVPHALFKSPYSGNGRGHLYAHHVCTPTFLRQCEGVLKRQGGILAEKQYHVVQDFAMEFTCCQGTVTFVGYSLFKTERYGYAGNLMMPDESILRELSLYINIVLLWETQSLVSEFLSREVAPYYDGNAGVDMFVYQEDGVYKLHPFVEVNLRKTMGLAAHEVYARRCHPDARGTFRIAYMPSADSMRQFHENQLVESPGSLEDGLWRSGAFFLTPIHADTSYAVVVELR